MVEPARLALTSTPSIGPSSAELTWPVSAAGAPASARSRPERAGTPAIVRARTTNNNGDLTRIDPPAAHAADRSNNKTKSHAKGQKFLTARMLPSVSLNHAALAPPAVAI